MDDQDRVDNFLDWLADEYKDTFERAYDIEIAMVLFPEIDWIGSLEAAADRAVEKDSDNNSMDNLAEHMTEKIIRERREVRRRRKR